MSTGNQQEMINDNRKTFPHFVGDQYKWTGLVLWTGL